MRVALLPSGLCWPEFQHGIPALRRDPVDDREARRGLFRRLYPPDHRLPCRQHRRKLRKPARNRLPDHRLTMKEDSTPEPAANPLSWLCAYFVSGSRFMVGTHQLFPVLSHGGDLPLFSVPSCGGDSPALKIQIALLLRLYYTR